MNKRVSIVLLVVISLYLFFFGLGKMALTDPDEPFYAETAREMMQKNEWVTPLIFDKPQFEKPPLYYWLTMVSYKIFGVNEFAARFPSALFGMLGVIAVYLFGTFLFSRKAGLFSGLILMTSFEYLLLARACVTDMLLCVLILYALFFFFYGHHKDKRVFYYLSAACLGLAVLTKGPIGIILPAAIVFSYLLLSKNLKTLIKIPYLKAGIVFLIIAAPWYYLMYKTHGVSFLDHFFGFQNVVRYMHPEHKIGDVFYYYFPVVFLGVLPWSFFLPENILVVFKYDSEKNRNYLFLLIWIAIFFVFFSFSRTKLPTYIFPIFPALALIIGRYWQIKTEKAVFNNFFAVLGFFYLISIPVGMAVGFLVSVSKYKFLMQPVINGAMLLMIPYVLSLFYFYRRDITKFFISIIVTMMACIIPLVFYFAPVIDKYESSKNVVSFLNNIAAENEQVGAETDYRRGVAFYLKNEDVIDVHKHHIITQFLNKKERVWCIIKDKNHVQLYTDSRTPYDKPTYVVYKYGKKVIITNIFPEGIEYIKIRSKSDPY